MRFIINKIPIYFPYKEIYPEQLNYIKEIILSIQTQGNICIQMPCGSGKTISLLSATISYQFYQKRIINKDKLLLNEPIKIIYCSRTIQEIEKTIIELERLYNYIIENYLEENKEIDFFAIGLTSRRHLCINKDINKENIEYECRNIISNWSIKKCKFYELIKKTNIILKGNKINNNINDIEDINKEILNIPSGVFTLKKAKEYFKLKGLCPYFSSRELINSADCLIYTYNYLLDPNIFEIICKKITKNSIIIFDEAHNIDNSCLENYSIEIKKNDLQKSILAIKNINNLLNELIKEKKQNYELYLGVEGIPYNINKPFLINNNNEVTYIPGNLRKSNHFISLLKRLIEFYKIKLKSTHLTTESTNSFIKSINETVFIDKETLKFTSQRLLQLINSMKINYCDNISSLKKIVDFVTLSSQFNDGFVIIFEPFDNFTRNLFNPTLKLCCLDASIGFKTVLDFRNIIITSGTLTPMEMYPLILNVNVKKLIDIGITLNRNSISPLIVTKGNDQQILTNEILTNEVINNQIINNEKMTTSFSLRNQPSNLRNYGTLIIELSQIIPDGLVVFFPSYIYLEEVISLWTEMNIINKIINNKLLFIETPNYLETEIALKAYKKSIDNGKGSIIFCVARGKISEGVDFQNQYGRCVILIGIPFQYTESISLIKRLEYLKDKYNLNESEFLIFDAMRHAAQCLGRVIRNKDDYGLMILADSRFNNKNKYNKLPSWIIGLLEDGNIGLSIDMAKSIAKNFYRNMAQKSIGKGFSVLNINDVEKLLEK